MPSLLLVVLLIMNVAVQEGTGDDPDVPPELLTVAERSNYQATARHADVVALLDALTESSPLVRRDSMGETFEGREIPVVILADPPVETAEEARASGKLVVFAFGNIHAGEVCGKEALPMLVRELVLAPELPGNRALLERLVLVVAPIYNADGNERYSTDSRPEQDGPAQGQGQRPNAQGLDLNRDCMKLESPEARAMAAFLTAWRPHLVIDTHTTDGSFHRYLLTYAPPLNPSGHPAPIGFVRDELLPAVTERLLARTGYDTFLYGNFQDVDGDDHGAWATYSALPRFGAQNHGLRGHMSILTEAYSHAPYRDRVLVTREFVRECLAYAAEHAATMRETVEQAWADTESASEEVGIRFEIADAPEPATIHGWVETTGTEGQIVPTDEPKDYVVVHRDRFAPTHSVPRPRAYLVPPGLDAVVDTLRLHGIELHAWQREPAEREVEVYRVDAITRADEPFQEHHIVTVEATPRRETREPGPGWTVVPVDQPLGTLAVYLLEPESDDGLVTWNFLDDQLIEGEDYPILRIPRD